MALPTLTKIVLTDEVVGVTLVPSGDRSVDGVSDTFVGLGHFSGIHFFVDVTAVAGTSPTLNLYFQNCQPNETDFYDIIAFTQLSAAGDRCASYVNGGNQEFAPQDAGLTAGTYVSTLLAPLSRLKWVIGGTSPVVSFSVSAYCYR